jgi:hypothetical protein
MLPEDKERLDQFEAGLSSMGLSLRVEQYGNIKSWLLLAGTKPLARIFYEPSNSFKERFSFTSIKSYP